MCVGIFLHEALRGFLEFLDRLICKVRQLLLGCIALVRGRLLQINLRLLLLIDESVARREVRLEPLHFAFGLFRLFAAFLIWAALLAAFALKFEFHLSSLPLATPPLPL